MDNAEVIVRNATIEDKNFIMSSWLEGQYWGSAYWKQMNQDDFFEMYAKLIAYRLSNTDTQVQVAVTKEDDLIISALVYNDSAIYWAYSKKDYRGKGILNLLMKDKEFKTYSADTKPGHAIGKKKNLKFNPSI